MIKDFYENREIFITGGTGVVGKALIEKLLKSCNVKKIYVLLRPKRTASVEQRLEKLREEMIFNVLRKLKPDSLTKLVGVPGDATLPYLGITEEWHEVLKDVSIVFHSAATVRFDEPLDVALKLNVGGVLECLKFAETLKNLKMLMHVSTYYSNPYLEYVEPKIYSSPMDWKFCLDLANKMPNRETLDFLTKKLLVGFPNTYTFTKNLAESLVNDYKDRLPLVIYRPSIVIMSHQEPEPGFPTGMVGILALFAVTGTGILKSMYLDRNVRLDFSPQDVCVKAMMFAMVKASRIYDKKKKLAQVPISICSTCNRITLPFKSIYGIADEYGLWEQLIFIKSTLIPGIHFTDSQFVYTFTILFKSVLPSLLGDALLCWTGRKPALMTALRKSITSLQVMEPFMFNNFDSPGMTDYEDMKDVSMDFNICSAMEFGANRQNLYTSMFNGLLKIRQLLFKERFESLLLAKRILIVKKVIYQTVRAILAYYFFSWLYRYAFKSIV